MAANNSAPLVRMSVVAPSGDNLDATPLETIKENTVIPVYPDDHLSVPMEVKFQDRDSIMSSGSVYKGRDEEDDDRPKMPDGGWGWMVVFSSLILSMIQDGISFSFGILYVEFFYEFGASSSATSWIGSLFLSVPLMTGPIMSTLVDKYGCRAMTIVGGLVSATGFILSSHVKTIGVMYVTFGVLSGLGLGLTYITAVVSIAFWFEKKRNLAVGLGACGTGIGTFVYAPITTYLLEQFGWRGTVLLLAGTLLNICVCGALMRDPDWIKEQNKQNSRLSKSSKSSKSSSVSLVSSPSERVTLDEVRNLIKSGTDAEFILQTLATTIESENNTMSKEHHQSVLNLPTFVKQDEKVPVEVLEQLSSNKKLYKIILENYPSLLLCRSTSEKGLDKLARDASLIQRVPVTVSLKLKKTKPKRLTHQFSLPDDPAAVNEPLLTNQKTDTKAAKVQPMTRTYSMPWLVKQFTATNPHPNYFKNTRFSRHSMIHRGAFLNKNKYKLRASSCPNIFRVSMTTLGREQDEPWYASILTAFKEMFDFSLFLEFHFFLMTLSTLILFAWFMTPYFYLAYHMKLYLYTSTQASFVISTIGVTNTIGMILLGWAGDQPWMSVTKTYGCCLILCGVFCSSMMFFTANYVMLVISAALFGFTLASSFSFTPQILVELVPLERFTTAYGLCLLCQGIGHLGGPPIAGMLYDVTKKYDVSFHLSGAWIIVSGLLILIIPFTKNRKMIGKGPVEKLANERG